ncbi:uncharacterized protein PRCAT00002643001 [Priceomyces carsonii]|uniref:uncharacterized protein n=1 Tax=Priceomyces carsonii TaxID=28549 RepID=UPI002ED98A68|nr:unnamed protein product [Priceomyces carsonii]
MPSNQGAVVTGSRNLENLVSVKETPFPQLEDDMIILKAVAYAVNPTDWKHILPESFASHLTSEILKKLGLGVRSLECVLGSLGSSVGYFVGKSFTLIQRGVVVGSDVSGIVESVGKNVTNFEKGDIVSASLHGGMNKNGGFSNYVMVSPNATIKFPRSQILRKPLSVGKHESSVIDSFEAAASIPVGLKTTALSFQYNLGIPPQESENKDDYLLIWGGATATGIIAIQIAKLIYGVKVITTASLKHHGKLQSLGADKTFNYNDLDVIEKLKEAGEHRIKYALDCVSSVETLQSVYDATEGSQDVRIDNLLFLNEKSINVKKGRKVVFTSTNGYLVDGRTHFGAKASTEMIDSYLEFWLNYLPSVLGKLKTAPLEVLPFGLESANEGLKLLIENKVSGSKLVFRNCKD